MKILYSPASPYSNKVRMAAHHAGFHAESVLTDTGANPPELIGNNPLGKIPVLILEDGRAIYDSRVIVDHLDRISGPGRLIPIADEARTAALTLAALAEGIIDAAILQVYEIRFRPSEERSATAMAWS